MNKSRLVVAGIAATVGRLSAALAGAALLYLGGGRPAQAGVFTYSTAGAQRTINCGLLQLDSAGQVGSNGQYTLNDNTAPYAFQILNLRSDIKPSGWRLANPLAPTTVTSDLYSLYASHPYQLGQQVSQNMSIYWKVNLPAVASGYTSGLNPLRQYDLLVMHTHNFFGLTRNERELLRQYVDEGGTLWIEDCGGARTLQNDGNAGTPTPDGLFLDVLFNDNSSNAAGFAYIGDGDHRHPILTTPYFLSNREVNDLGDKDVAFYFMTSMGSATSPPEPFTVLSAVGNSAHNGLPYIAAGDYGSGHVIIDNSDSLDDINNPVQGGNDTGYCPANVMAAHIEDLKLMVNIIAWTSSTTATQQGNVRRTGVQPKATVSGALDKGWLYPDQQYNNATPNPVSLQGEGVAIAGNIAYVTSIDSVGASGTATPTLHAFDLIPGEDLNQDNNPDDGDPLGVDPNIIDPITSKPISYTHDWSAGLTHDELWSAIPNAKALALSPPVVAALPANAVLPGAVTVNAAGYYDSVMVEDDSGNVWVYDATSNPATATIAPLVELVPPHPAKGSFKTDGVPVPAPAYYHGWIIAAQPRDASNSNRPSVFLTYLPTGYQGQVVLDPPSGGSFAIDTTPITCSPAVASIPSLDNGYGGDDIICYVATSEAVYPLYLGSRDEQFRNAGANNFTSKTTVMSTAPGGSALQNIGPIVPAAEDSFSLGANRAFVYLNPSPNLTSGGVPAFRGASVAADGLTIQVTPASGENPTVAYGDYDVMPGLTNLGGSASTLSRHQIQAQIGGLTTTDPGASVTGVAVGPDGVLYMNVNEGANSYIEAVQEQNPNLSGPGTVVKWRLSLPNGPIDGVTYPFGAGTQLVGSPVVDQNNVYSLAYNVTSGLSYVICLNPNPLCQVHLGQSVSGPVTLQQVDENGIQQSISPQQYQVTDAVNGIVDLKNFSMSGTSVYAIAPNITASLPMQATFATSTSITQQGQTAGTSTATGSYPISTDGHGSSLIAWYAKVPFSTLPANSQPGQLSLFGNTLYFGNGVIGKQTDIGYAILPSSSGDIDANHILNPLKLGRFTLDCGQVMTSLAASGSYLVAAGSPTAGNPGGIEGAVDAKTMIADNNRLIEIESSGNALWSLDSTAQQVVAGDTGNIRTSADYTGSIESPQLYPGTTNATTQVSLSRPSSITKISDNDILFADTGNNRCVEVDRSGNVLWELTDFRDTSGLLTPGQPLTVNHPTSVVHWRQQVTDTTVTPNAQKVIEHYLVADAGNYRIIEIDDIYTNGQIANPSTDYHVLHWATHTQDRSGRQYRYTWADRYFFNGTVSIVAAVSNKQIAPLLNPASGVPTLDAAGRDTNGSSLVLLTYYPTPSFNSGNGGSTPNNGTATGGVPIYSGTPWTVTAATFTDPSNGMPSYLIDHVTYKPTGSATAVTMPIRNLRFLSSYRPLGQTVDNIMIADDNGIFDGVAAASGLGQFNFLIDTTGVNGFSFTTVDYNAMLTDLSAKLGQPSPYPTGVFTATSAQRLSNKDYLITNGASVGDAWPYDASGSASAQANNNAHSGGCVFEIDPITKLLITGGIYGRSIPSTSFSKTGPKNSGPLSQPAFAVRSE